MSILSCSAEHMATRPPAIEIRSRSQGPLGANNDASSRPLPSPRLHVAGDVPPELSPLDAFAAQSRLLARKLEEGIREGKRISRLPPLSIEGAFVTPRPGYFRMTSAHDLGDQTEESHSPGFGIKMEVENTAFRPVSVHPRMSKIPHVGPGLNSSRTEQPDHESNRGRKPLEPNETLRIRKEESPGSIDQESHNRNEDSSPSYFPNRPSIDSISQQRHSPRKPLEPPNYDIRALAPPRSPFTQKAPSLRSASMDDSDEDYSSSIGVRTYLRKFSSSSGLSTSPISPLMYSQPRSPSVCSDVSAANRLSRPAFNFSRPLSRASEPLAEVTVRQSSADSDQFLFMNETSHTSVNMCHTESLDGINEAPVAPSYVCSEFSLPRGKLLQRSSTNPLNLERNDITSNQDNHELLTSTSPPLPSYIRSSKAISTTVESGVSNNGQSFSISTQNQGESTEGSSTTATEMLKSGQSILNNIPKQETSIEASAEWHVTKGIDCHERGSLNESTYHLRIAARQNHPTGMLLYALACRHGWGMRPNQQEGVQWLRKAADLAILEVADDEDSVKEGKAIDFLDQKTRKAQFALSIYELGVSHLNGWGIEQDKVLALRCFEIAGCKFFYISRLDFILMWIGDVAWGDGDALAEAGFCYAQGIGCKKDLKRSARFYRFAESKGISMVGNSW